MKIVVLAEVKSFFNRILGGLAMFAVFVLVAFTTMRLAIHGGEVEVPELTGMTVSDATHLIDGRGLNLVLVNRFYSTTVPAGHIISQSPTPGVMVRHEWEVRAIESLGPQKVAIPDVSGMDERAATMTLRRLSLDLGDVAHLPASGPSESVLAQTPPPNAGGVDTPRVSLLLSQKNDGRETAFVMPSVVGLSLDAATSRLAGLGLYVAQAVPPDAPPPGAIAAVPFTVPTQGTVQAQSPAAGHRVLKGQGIRLTVGSS